MITDDMIAKALAASDKIRRHFDPTGKMRMRAALEAVEADIRNAAIDDARRAMTAYRNSPHMFAAAGIYSVEQAIEALKTKVTQ